MRRDATAGQDRTAEASPAPGAAPRSRHIMHGPHALHHTHRNTRTGRTPGPHAPGMRTKHGGKHGGAGDTRHTVLGARARPHAGLTFTDTRWTDAGNSGQAESDAAPGAHGRTLGARLARPRRQEHVLGADPGARRGARGGLENPRVRREASQPAQGPPGPGPVCPGAGVEGVVGVQVTLLLPRHLGRSGWTSVCGRMSVYVIRPLGRALALFPSPSQNSGACGQFMFAHGELDPHGSTHTQSVQHVYFSPVNTLGNSLALPSLGEAAARWPQGHREASLATWGPHT